ncbi:hypothetical protein [Xanthomonas phage RTH11]|nr:hypothetical protein [Xanthomonas phage RTH11]
MFHPETYQAKRSSLNEIMLQQLVTFMRSVMPAEGKRVIDNMFDQYARGQDALKSAEAERVLGPVVKEEGVDYADRGLIFEYMKANLGRTYFDMDEKTAAPDGSIGTAGFGTKFKDWLASLPDFDESISPDMQTGFYRDDNTLGGAQHGNKSLPVLVLRHGSQLIASVYNNYLSPVVLHLDHIPTDFPWHLKSKSALRSEMYAYRGDLKVSELEELLGAALATAGVTNAVQAPVLPEVTNGLSQVKSVEELEQAETVQLTNDADAILAGADAPADN